MKPSTIALALMVSAAPALQAQPQWAQADADLQAGRADAALAALGTAQDAAAHNLRCRVQFSLEHWDDAVNECKAAVALDSSNARYHLWLGRAYGEKADRASAFSAFGLAKQTVREFETADSLDNHDGEILADLGEYYTEAPGVVGGGTDKAEKVATRLDSIDPVRAHDLRARLAEKHGNQATAEREFKQEIAVGPHPAFGWMNLASYYRRQKRLDDMAQAAQTGNNLAEKDRAASVAWYNGASVLIRSGQQPQLAAEMLASYLASPKKTEEAPAFAAHVKLAKLKQQLGDKAGAAAEIEAARQLASTYKPAQQGLQ